MTRSDTRADPLRQLAAMSRRRFLGRRAWPSVAWPSGRACWRRAADDDDGGGTAAGTGTAPEFDADDQRLAAHLQLARSTSTRRPSASSRRRAASSVTYTEDFNDNEEYFARIREPLSRNQDIGADLFIVTDFLVNRLIGLGWLGSARRRQHPEQGQPASPTLAEVDVRPRPDVQHALGRRASSSIAYNPRADRARDHQPRRPLRPRVQGAGHRCFSDLRDGIGHGPAHQGKSPAEATTETVQAAVDKVQEAKDDGPDPAVHRQRLHATTSPPATWRSPRPTRATSPSCSSTTRTSQFVFARRGHAVVVGQHGHPAPRPRTPTGGRGVDELRLRPGQRRPDHSPTSSTSPRCEGIGRGAGGRLRPERWPSNPLINPPQRRGTGRGLAGASPTRRTRSTSAMYADGDPGLTGPHGRVGDGLGRWPAPRPAGTRRRITPYLLSLPALAYLAVFFVIPLWSRCCRTSLSVNVGLGLLTRRWSSAGSSQLQPTPSATYDRADHPVVRGTPWPPPCCALVMAYPLAYVLAFKAGRWKNVLLGLVILPFFITFLDPHAGLEDDPRRRRRRSSSVLDFHRPLTEQRPDPVDPAGPSSAG